MAASVRLTLLALLAAAVCADAGLPEVGTSRHCIALQYSAPNKSATSKAKTPDAPLSTYEEIACEAATGKTAILLLGPANASQSPLRRQTCVDGSSSRTQSFWNAVFSLDHQQLGQWAAPAVAFLWAPETLRTFFTRRQMTIATSFDIDSHARQLHGPSIAANHKAGELIKIGAFPPSRRTSGWLVCDPEVLADGHTIATLCGQSTSILPQGLLEVLGLVPATSFITLTGMHTPQTPNAYRYTCTIAVGSPQQLCIRMASPATLAADPVKFNVTTSDVPDVAATVLFALLVLFGIWQSVLQRSKVAQLLCAGLFGVIFLAVAFLVYVFRDLSRTKLGKVGIGAAALGGFAAITEGLLSAVLSYILVSAQVNLTVQLSLLLVYILSSALAYYFLGGRLMQATVLVVKVARLAIVVGLLFYNPEACVVGLVGVLWFYYGVLVMGGRVILWLFSAVWGRVFSREGDPQDVLPARASVAVDYAKPLAQGFGGTRAQKMKRFEDSGKEHTRLALEKLAATIRANPAKYAAMVKDPAVIIRFAGQKDEDEDQ